MRLRVLGIVLAGGKGTRLYPLTKERAKPAVPFGGKYRIVDFVLSNFINSGIYSIYVLTQFKSQSLLQHLSDGWQFGGVLKNHFIIPVPAQMRSADETWYQGTADAIYQNVNLIEQSDPHLVAIFGADHIYRMNVASMIEYHEQKRAEITVAAIPVDRKFAAEFGVIETAPDGRIVGFHEKRPDAPTIPGSTEQVYASMGNYVFSTRTLLRELYADAARERQLPRLRARHPARARAAGRDVRLRLPGQPDPGRGAGAAAYWRDVGTLDAYYEAHMDLRAVSPSLNLYNGEWPLRTASYADPPAKFTFDDEDRRGHAIDSIVSGGCILSGRHGAQLGARALGARAQRRARRGLRDPRQLRHRPPGEDPPGHPRQERPHPRGRHDRLRPRPRPQVPPRHRQRHRRGGRAALLGRTSRPCSSESRRTPRSVSAGTRAPSLERACATPTGRCDGRPRAPGRCRPGPRRDA